MKKNSEGMKSNFVVLEELSAKEALSKNDVSAFFTKDGFINGEFG